jgi:hypothetical protein
MLYHVTWDARPILPMRESTAISGAASTWRDAQ